MFPRKKLSLKIASFYVAYVVVILISSLILFELGIRFQMAFSDKSLSSQLQKANHEIPPPIVNACEIPFWEQASLGSIVQPSIYSDVFYKLKPNIKTCFYDSPVITNVSGLRANKDYKQPKPENVYRILILGDSQTFGQGVSYEETFGYYLEQELENIIPDKEVEVINAGVPGYNTAMEAAYLKQYGMQYEPDCILVLFIGNDLGLPWLMMKERNVLTLKKLYFLDFLRRFKDIYQPNENWFQHPSVSLAGYVSEEDQKRVPKKYRYMVGVDGYNQAMKSIMNSVGSKKIPVINLADYGFLNDIIDTSKLTDYQKNLGIITPFFEFPENQEYKISKKDQHLNPNGHRELGKRILQVFIRNILNESLYNNCFEVDSCLKIL